MLALWAWWVWWVCRVYRMDNEHCMREAGSYQLQLLLLLLLLFPHFEIQGFGVPVPEVLHVDVDKEMGMNTVVVFERVHCLDLKKNCCWRWFGREKDDGWQSL
ncbi:hypothetical protein BCR41DRAFT_348047 [Lobosporangium transversale]|uniref:Uncharacterized protein n=1 Tax=Lobosporangium transversale TaxID=64571 RepID=A0A1Y2GWY0_9FUNG|nr:hypothetical protein BCR41DRAFT_348047 [Lobosporangium transversale]ORZ26281.1 hypothetical protein BCR41DRAFT_348047 [Lobosporangium transversale]|eukprot:XP_021884046.1 hypothetical protein BCR41DRAFT_348047 [Lobosporangium transversale]